MSETLIETPSAANHVPAPLTGEDKSTIDAFYARYGVTNASPTEKIAVLQKEIQARSFFSLGGNETPEMELRANERIFLLKKKTER